MNNDKNGWWDTEEELQQPGAEQNSTETPLLYCDNCEWLSLTEEEQNQYKGKHEHFMYHLCLRNKKKVVHGHSHPRIEQPKWCGGKVVV